MKKFACLIILVAFNTICLAQNVFEQNNPLNGPEKNNSRQQDSLPESDIAHQRYTWQWKHEGVYREIVPLDTSLDGIHNFNYIFKKNISNTYLANLPSPYLSNIFITRETVQDFYPLTNIRAFLFKPEDALYFNTTTPYSRLRYYTGGGKGKGENFLDIWHVQNINPYWNAGIRYNLISSDGRYMDQKAKAYHFSLFSSYEKERTVLNLFLNQNNGHFNENGGIKDRTYITDSTENAENIPVNLTGSNASNNYRNTNFQLQAQYNLGKKKEVIQAEDTSYTYPGKVLFNFRAEGNEHWYKESSVNMDFYPHTYIDSTFSYDLITNQFYDISGKFVMNEHPKHKYLPGLYAGIRFQHEHYKQRTAYDSITHTESFGNTNCSNTYLTGGIFNVDTNASFHYDAEGQLCILGPDAGNFSLDGFVRQSLNKNRKTYIQANATIELQSVNPFFDRYIGNHNIWENNFKAIKTIQVQGKYVNQRLRNETGMGFSNIFNYVYFDTAAMPRQTNKTLIVLTAWVKENFKLGNFYFDQTIYFQKSTQEDILSLPIISVYSHNYYQNFLFKKALLLQFGIDVFYHTKFYSDNYMPSIMQFYNQRKHKTGNYPKIDIFLDLNIKRAHIFVKYEHLNYPLKKHGDFFSAADYPINPGMLKFGIQWDFFN